MDPPPAQELASGIVECVAETSFSGVIRVDVAGEVLFEAAFGAADRRWGVANTVRTRIGVASGAKGITALVVMSLVERGALTLDTTARSILGDDVPLIDDAVTVEHLLGHRSGIGDYLDEDDAGAISDYVMTVPLHQLDSAESYVVALDGHPTKFAPGTDFAYCNGGFVALAVLAQRASGVTYYELVDQIVCRPAGLQATAFLRSDRLPDDVAVGYLEANGLWNNVLHLPVRGCGDGGLYTTVGDVHRLWEALFAGRIVSADSLAVMLRPRSEVPRMSCRYGLGFWLHGTNDAAKLEGYDAGASFRTVHQPSRQITYTVMANTSPGAWPVLDHLEAVLGT